MHWSQQVLWLCVDMYTATSSEQLVGQPSQGGGRIGRHVVGYACTRHIKCTQTVCYVSDLAASRLIYKAYPSST